MSFVVTLVSSEKPLTPGHIETATAALGKCGRPEWLAPEKAVDIPLEKKPARAAWNNLIEKMAKDKIDAFIQPEQNRRKKLLIADMDSTIVKGEMLDELATHAGKEKEIAAITARAMAGELNFESALRERVNMLTGLPATALEKTLAAAQLNPGAKTLVATMTAHGALCVLVSGGFTVFTGEIARRAGFHLHHGNELVFDGVTLAGKVKEPILGKEAKHALLQFYIRQGDINSMETLALGDGANDLLMLQGAGLGIGYHPKPLLREKLENCILYGDLSTALYAQGYRAAEIVNA